MKKFFVTLLMLALCLSIVACDQAPTTDSSAEHAQQTSQNATTEEAKPITYTYKVEAMQNAECVYYGPDDYVPNSPDPSKVQGKIKVWSQCPNCGTENIGSHTIDPASLDFSFGDTIMHSDTDSCMDCYWEKDIDQFMWTIRITRISE